MLIIKVHLNFSFSYVHKDSLKPGDYRLCKTRKYAARYNRFNVHSGVAKVKEIAADGWMTYRSIELIEVRK